MPDQSLLTCCETDCKLRDYATAAYIIITIYCVLTLVGVGVTIAGIYSLLK